MGRSGIANSLHTVETQKLEPGSTTVASNNPEGMTGSSQTWNNFEAERRGRHARRRVGGVSLVIVWR